MQRLRDERKETRQHVTEQHVTEQHVTTEKTKNLPLQTLLPLLFLTQHTRHNYREKTQQYQKPVRKQASFSSLQYRRRIIVTKIANRL